MLPTDGKTANGFENKIRWSFFNPLDNFLKFKAARNESFFNRFALL